MLFLVYAKLDQATLVEIASVLNWKQLLELLVLLTFDALCHLAFEF